MKLHPSGTLENRGAKCQEGRKRERQLQSSDSQTGSHTFPALYDSLSTCQSNDLFLVLPLTWAWRATCHHCVSQAHEKPGNREGHTLSQPSLLCSLYPYQCSCDSLTFCINFILIKKNQVKIGPDLSHSRLSVHL